MGQLSIPVQGSAGTEMMNGASSGGGGGAGGAVIGGMMGMLSNWMNNAQQQHNNELLANQQNVQNMQQGLQNNELAMRMWRDTNYSAQIKEMEKAGLNVGLMYKSGAQGGTTASPAGNVRSGDNTKGDNIGAMAMQGLGMMSQVELNQAMAEKAKAEAEAIRGYEKDKAGASTTNIEADTTVKEEQTKNIIADTQLKIKEAEAQGMRNDITHKTLNDQITSIKTKAINDYMEGQILLQKEVTEKIGQDKLIAEIGKITNEVNVMIQGVNNDTQRTVNNTDDTFTKRLEVYVRAELEKLGIEQRYIQTIVQGVLGIGLLKR